MIRLRTLGSVDLRATDGTQVQSVLRQPKRLALLIYLALNEPVFHRRDRLLAVFWPESDEERARGSLSQAVFQLRAALGKDVIVSRGDDEIGLTTGRVWCDAAAFDECIRNSQPAEAMALYAGELLPGFNIDDAPDFERWLDEERTRRAQEAARACVELSERAGHTGDSPLAIDWLRRAISIQPFSEPAHQRLISLLDESGDRAAALRAFDDLSALLRAEFDAEPSAETLELMHAVRARGDAKAMVRPLQLAGATMPASAGTPRRRPRRIALGVVAVALLAGAAIWGALGNRRGTAHRPPVNRVAVLYFTDESANRDLAYLAEGLTSTLIDQLGQVRKLQVISRNGVRPFRGNAVPLDSIARQLDVGTLVGGSITRSADKLRITVELIDGVTGVVLQSRKLERPNGELFALLDDLSSEVASFLRVTVGQEIRLREWQAETKSVDAWRLLQEAEVARASAEEHENAGRVSDAIATLVRADSLSARAFAIDRRFLAAQVMRGRIAERRGWLAFVTGKPDSVSRWLTDAREYAQRVIAADAKNAAAYELRGGASYLHWVLTPATASDSLLAAAERDLRASMRLAADRPRAVSRLSNVLYAQGKFLESRDEALRALEADAYLTDANQIMVRLFETSFEVGDDAEAGHWCDEIRRRLAGQWPTAWCDLMLLAWARDANPDPRKAMHVLANFAPADPEHLRIGMQPRITVLSAAVLARAGQLDSANAMLERAHSMAPNDIELLPLEAAARALMKEQDRATDLLQRYLQMNPAARQRVVKQRVFREISDRLR